MSCRNGNFYKLPYILGCTLLLAACNPIHKPDENPKISVTMPGIYSGDQSERSAADIVINKFWWQKFEREYLNDLISRSYTHNQEVLQAVAVLKQAQALSRRTGTDRLPQIDLEGDFRKEREDYETQHSNSSFGASLAWEADIFNRIGSAAEADKYEKLARAEDVEAVKLVLASEIVNSYFGAAAAHRRIELLKEQARLDRELLDLLRLRVDNGVGTNVDVLRQNARVADSEALIPLAEADLAVFENRLDVLAGEVPDGKFRVPAEETLDFIEKMPMLGVPASLLQYRPDLRSLKAELVAADMDIGAAIADRLPRITISSSYMYSDTASFGGPVAMLMGAFVQPLLDWGKRKAEVERNKALYEEKLAAYTQGFLEAVEDVENALISEKKQREFLKRLKDQENLLREAVSLSEGRYKQGVDDYLPVIDALQELRTIERSMITEQLELISIRVNLYRALGGIISVTIPKKDVNID